MENADGSIGHAEARIGDAVVMTFEAAEDRRIGAAVVMTFEAAEDWPPLPALLRVFVGNADRVMRRTIRRTEPSRRKRLRP